MHVANRAVAILVFPTVLKAGFGAELTIRVDQVGFGGRSRLILETAGDNL
jgi:hypothetical protein